MHLIYQLISLDGSKWHQCHFMMLKQDGLYQNDTLTIPAKANLRKDLADLADDTSRRRLTAAQKKAQMLHSRLMLDETLRLERLERAEAGYRALGLRPASQAKTPADAPKTTQENISDDVSSGSWIGGFDHATKSALKVPGGPKVAKSVAWADSVQDSHPRRDDQLDVVQFRQLEDEINALQIYT